MPGVTSRRLVIDASIARSAGGMDAVDPRSKYCRDFLQAVLQICHQIVMTAEIRDEWDRHQSRFALTWRRSMVARKKMCLLVAPDHAGERSRIEALAVSENDCQAMLKDCHLVLAALVTDRVIASLDEAVRALFGRATAHLSELGTIVWVNPGLAEERVIVWLEDGAKPEKERLLGA